MHHNVGTCLWHDDAINQRIGKMPKACPYVMVLSLWRFSGKFLGIDYAMLPNCECNQKQKHKKTALEQCGMLRIWRSQKAVFYVFVSVPQYFSTEPYLLIIVGGSWHVNVVGRNHDSIRHVTHPTLLWHQDAFCHQIFHITARRIG